MSKKRIVNISRRVHLRRGYLKMENDTCPKCGCREIRQGKQVAGGKMIPIDKVGMSFGSSVIADICSECGYIIEMKVEKPDIFK